jgi:putative colanic acid biosynthesis acetyltransferase WcaF
VQPEEPYLGEGTQTPYPASQLLSRLLWLAVQSTIFRFSPRPFHGFRAFLLKLFGAEIPEPRKVVIFPTAKVIFPARLSMEPRSMVGPRVTLYNLARITLKRGSNISQNCHLCAGTHDYGLWRMPLVAKPITIGINAWLGADVFVGPGVTVGELSVVGARSVVVKDVAPMTVSAGNPAKFIKPRKLPQ